MSEDYVNAHCTECGEEKPCRASTIIGMYYGDIHGKCDACKFSWAGVMRDSGDGE